MDTRPNIVYIFADQMRAHATGYAGDPNVRTPYLDRLAGESLNFTNAVSNCPICTPYRASLLTGQYPLTHGLFMNDLCLPDNGHSLGQELARAGYDTAWIGKWHLDGHGRSAPVPRERRQGFAYWKALECTHDYRNSKYYIGDDPTPQLWNGYDAYAQADDAAEFIHRRSGDSPFALFVSPGTPHGPYETAPDDVQATYAAEKLVLRTNVPSHLRDQVRKCLVGFYAHITALDRCVETIDQALTTAGLRENTLFIFTADHGDMVGSQSCVPGEIYGPAKQVPYDESVLVPFLLRYPARFGMHRQVIDTPLATPDIMPTLLSCVGLPIPETVEGFDVLASGAGTAAGRRPGVLIANYHPFNDWRTERGGRPYRGIRTRRHTFVRDRNGPWLLFDNHQDPFQMTNLVNKPAQAAVQRELDQALSALLAEQNDRFEAPEELRARYGYTVDEEEQIPIIW